MVIPINDLLTFNFYIPSYQRGYRWTNFEVTDLLDDIWEFRNEEKGREEFYCLQPIVISENREENRYYVIDGQQRLTTIHIILSYLKDILPLLGKSQFKIEYATRPGSSRFLNSINPLEKNDNIDYYHMVEAYDTIEKWFNAHDGTAKINFLSTLLGDDGNNVRVIWYKLNDNVKPIEVFTRLNMGKIGLTNAELIKALFLSTSHKMTEEQKKMVIQRQKEIAAEWDYFETQLRNEEFWGFLHNGNQKYDNHIELVFDLIAKNLTKDGKRGNIDKNYTFRHFSSKIKNIEMVWDQWDEIKSVFQFLHDWFTDQILYHLVGFLICVREDLGEILEMANTKTKKEFYEAIRRIIGKHIDGNINELTYPDDREKLRKVLLLFNLLSILNNPKTNMRFQFGRYKIERWDIEHIHSIASDPPRANAHQRAWLKDILDFSDDDELKKEIEEYLNTPPNERNYEFKELYNRIIEKYSEDNTIEDINDISNLSLLDMGTNRGYKNAVFPVKRKVIIEKDEMGTFVPLCTKNVFLKYYNKNVEQSIFWGRADRNSYKSTLISTIKEYLDGKNYELL